MGNKLPLCKNNKCKCEDKECDYLHKQYGLKKWVFCVIRSAIILGIIAPFAAETIFPFLCKNQYVLNHLSTWNQFVSIVLGVVAVVLSIVSIIMSFKNYDDTYKLSEKYTIQLSNMEKMIDTMDEMKNNIYYNSSKTEKINAPENVRFVSLGKSK